VLPERRVKLFRNGRNQAVRIPREFELPGKDAVMRKEGQLAIEPAKPASLLALLATLAPLAEELPPIAEFELDRSSFDTHPSCLFRLPAGGLREADALVSNTLSSHVQFDPTNQSAL
jgi:antitoxin VapB